MRHGNKNKFKQWFVEHRLSLLTLWHIKQIFFCRLQAMIQLFKRRQDEAIPIQRHVNLEQKAGLQAHDCKQPSSSFLVQTRKMSAHARSATWETMQRLRPWYRCPSALEKGYVALRSRREPLDDQRSMRGLSDRHSANALRILRVECTCLKLFFDRTGHKNVTSTRTGHILWPA